MQRCLFLLLPAALIAADSAPAEFFEMKVRPLLATNCFTCHTGANKMGGLEMVSREALLKGGGRGPALTPGDPDASLLIRAVRQIDDKLKMPPSGKLSDTEIGDLAAWIKNGAIWPEATAAKAAVATGYKITPEQRAWWAFQPVRKPASPAVKDKAWPRTDIDRFVLARLEAKGLKPVAPADRRSLIRRAYFDMIGLPPRPEEVDEFLKDTSPAAFAKVVDKLLASPHYGERWGRYWLDIARYSDDKLNSTQDEPYANAWRYRDWVIQAFHDDMPYDLFVKAQIAGDQLPRPDKDKFVAGLGFYSLSPEFQDDRVDATTRGFLALTAACAQCHDHKFDPIPTKDYYAMLGVFSSTRISEFPLAPAAVVKKYKESKEGVEAQQKEIDEFLDKQASQLAEIFAARTARYLGAARGGEAGDLDTETLDRWKKYLAAEREHPFLNEGVTPEAFQERLLDVIKEKKKIDETNFIRLGGSQARNDLARADLLSLERDKYFFWRDLMGKDRFGKFESGLFYYRSGKIERFLSGPWLAHLNALRAELDRRKKAVPEPYPFYHTIIDIEKPRNTRVQIRGSRDNLGEEAPRAFMTILCDGAPIPFANGSGRLELAEAIASDKNPLTARVMVNRLWQWHFGRPLVGTPSNFGQLGEKPSHPELLDYLAARFMEQGWSVKKLHREVLLSRVYQLSAAVTPINAAEDPDNRLLWHFPRRRLDIEPLRDTLLEVTGELDTTPGGAPSRLTEESNRRRTVYGFVSRRRLDGTLALFDFPNPNSHSEARIETGTPLQQLFFLNSAFIEARAKAFAKRIEGAGDEAGRVALAYRILYSRAPRPEEVRLALEFVRAEKDGWARYAQALLGSNELLFVN